MYACMYVCMYVSHDETPATLQAHVFGQIYVNRGLFLLRLLMSSFAIKKIIPVRIMVICRNL